MVHSPSAHTHRAVDADVLTVEKIMQCIRDLPPPPKTTFASCRMFPKGAVGFTGEDGERFTIAHPDYWDLVARQMKDATPTMAVSDMALKGAVLPLWGITVANLDLDPAERRRVVDQMMKAMSRVAASQPDMKPGTGGMHPNPREGEAS